MSQVITNAFEQYWQSSLAAEQPVVLDEFILADIPNLDITAPIDPDTVLPPESQIVHRQNVDQRGRINSNAVAYSIVMDTTVGDFSFNAMFLRNKANGVIGMIVYKGRETKLKTDQTTGQTGNSLVKSMLMGYDQAAEATLTLVDAGTWQIDYAARLRGMDENIRQLQADLYGHHTFVGDGFKLIEKDGAYQVTPGVAIVGGLRVELKQPEVIHPGTKPIGVWVDVHRAGSLLSEHQNHFTIITSVADLADHVDGNSYQHYVAKLGAVQADNTVEDSRDQSGDNESAGGLPDTFTLWERSMGEAGFATAGSFERGGKVLRASDVIIYASKGEAYTWGGELPKTVNADSTPWNTGGVGPGKWIPQSKKLLRDELAGQRGASVIGAEHGKSVQYELESMKMDLNKSVLAQIKFKAQRANSQWGQPGPINILADSMGFGYFASYENGVPTYGGMFYHRWVSIMARMFAAEFNTGHYLTCNPNIYEYGGDEDIVKRVAYNGTWTLKNAGLYTSNLLVGQAACTSTPGAYSDYKFPATFSNCWIYYVVQPGGGELTITQNGSEPMVISCDGPELKNAVISIPVTANPQGYCTLRIAKSDVGSGEVGVSAISPTQGVRENGYKEGAGLNAFAAPGRRLQDVSESVIAAACQNAAGLILALGFNDNPLNGSGQEVGRAAFTQRVNWVISNCKANNTPLIVADFSWKNTKDQFTRMELRRAASEVGGIYIPFPDMLQGGTVPNEAERLASGMWHDAAHPNKKGHKWIAESIGKAIGLSCSSKNEAIRNHDYWMSLPLTSTFSNILTNIPRNLAAYKISGDFVHIRTQIKMAAGGAFPVGVNTICGDAVNSMWWIVPPLKLNAFYLTKLHDVNENTGVIQGFSSFSGAGVKSCVLALVRPSGVSLTAFNGASSFEIERWESADV